MSLAAKIALRYLSGRKSHSAVNAIAIVSLVGVAVATAAIVCVLSVFNGFRDVLADKLDTLSPDIVVTRGDGRVFGDAPRLAECISEIGGVESATPEICVQALALLGSRELPVTLLGVDADRFGGHTALDSLFFDGSEPLRAPVSDLEAAPASLAVGTASNLGVNAFGQRILVFAPRREGRINMANPGASFEVDSVEVTSIYRSGQKEFDENLLITDRERVQRLLQYGPGDASSIRVTLAPGAPASAIAAKIETALGEGFRVRDRVMQHEVNFRMIEIEKYVTFLLLVFILVIASFNIVSTLCMLVIEKEETLSTLDALGMPRLKIGAVFAWESWLVSLAGGIAGVLLGAVLCLLQEHFGLVKLNGEGESMLLSSYPVSLEWGDLFLAMVPVTVIAALTAATASRYALRRLKGSCYG